MSDSKKYKCDGCKYQYEDYSYCAKKLNFDPPHPCYECYIWTYGEDSERKKWEKGERVHFSCEGCLYQDTSGLLVCMKCCNKSDIFSHKVNYKSRFFNKSEINGMIDSIIDDI
jgi:hypothetical protein